MNDQTETENRAERASGSSSDRTRWTDTVVAHRRSVGTLQWGFRKRPRLTVIAIILLIQAIVVATVAYFNTTVSIPLDLLKTVDVNVLAPAASQHPP